MTSQAHPPVGGPSVGTGSGPVESVRQSARESVRRGTAAATALLERPLTAYYLLLGATALLLSIGLMEVLSASSVSAFEGPHHDSYFWFFRQLQWAAIGIPTAFAVSRLPLGLIRRFAWIGVLVSVVLIGLTKSPLGVTVNGNTNWLAFGGIVIQPAELAKFSLILWIAHVYAVKVRLLQDPKHVLIPVAPMVVLIAGLVVGLGHDLGTGLVLLAIALGMLFVAGAPVRIFVAAASAVSVVALVLATTSSERLSRMTSFADPLSDFSNTGYQAGHGLLGMASGGLFGKGIGASQQKWGTLPEAHTDFIFAVLGEELGLAGTLLVIALFIAIVYSGIRIAMRSSDPFVTFLAAGITIWLSVQTLINIGMVLALLPVIGVPLPLVSYGGSSLVPVLVSIGLLVSFARREPAAAAVLAARKPARQGSRRTARPAARRPVEPTPRSTSVRGTRTAPAGSSGAS